MSDNLGARAFAKSYAGVWAKSDSKTAVDLRIVDDKDVLIELTDNKLTVDWTRVEAVCELPRPDTNDLTATMLWIVCRLVVAVRDDAFERGMDNVYCD